MILQLLEEDRQDDTAAVTILLHMKELLLTWDRERVSKGVVLAVDDANQLLSELDAIVLIVLTRSTSVVRQLAWQVLEAYEPLYLAAVGTDTEERNDLLAFVADNETTLTMHGAGRTGRAAGRARTSDVDGMASPLGARPCALCHDATAPSHGPCRDFARSL